MKGFFIHLFVLISFVQSAFSQVIFPIDSTTNKIVFKYSIQFSGKINQENMYANIQDWLTKNPTAFTNQNDLFQKDSADLNKAKRKTEVDNAFNNQQPFKMLNPTNYSMIGRGLYKYMGNNTEPIKIVYTEYDILLEVAQNQVNLSILNIRYVHFNPATFSPSIIYGWKGLRPCEGTNRLEYLAQNQTFPVEYDRYAKSLENNIKGLVNQLSSYLLDKKTIAESSMPR